jgi:hypothetical protein
MRKLLAALALAFAMCGPAAACEMIIGSGLFGPCGGSTYSGPGDVISGASVWYGLRAYSAAKAGTKIANICNSGDASCADINSTATGDFDVTTAQGAPLNCGGAGGTCTIKTLYDQSGTNACSGACDVTQATIANRPTLTFSCIGSKVCATFVRASTQYLARGAGYAGAAQPFSMSSVVERTGTTTSFNLYFGLNGAQMEASSTASETGAYCGAHYSRVANDSAWHAVQVLCNGTSGKLDVDTTLFISANIGTNAIGTTFMTIGGGSAGVNSLDGKWEETGLWASDTSSSFSGLQSNQATYWGY